jgi:hypothetical protein
MGELLKSIGERIGGALRPALTRGSTYGVIGGTATGAIALAQPATMPNTTGLTPNAQLLVIMVATVLPMILQFVYEVFKRPGKDDRK